MPFIVRCPNLQCQKYNLVEDEFRGKVVDCLVCGNGMQVSSDPGVDSKSLRSPKGPDKNEAGKNEAGKIGPDKVEPGRIAPDTRESSQQHKTPPTDVGSICNCPQCQTKLRIPPTPAGQRIRCPKCDHVF